MVGNEIAYDENSKALAALLGEVLEGIPSVSEIVQAQGVSVGAAQTYRQAMTEVLHQLAQIVSTSIDETIDFSRRVEEALAALRAADVDAEERARKIFDSIEPGSAPVPSRSPNGAEAATDEDSQRAVRVIGSSGVGTGK